MDKRLYPLLPPKRQPWNHKEQQRYNSYCNSCDTGLERVMVNNLEVNEK